LEIKVKSLLLWKKSTNKREWDSDHWGEPGPNVFGIHESPKPFRFIYCADLYLPMGADQSHSR